MIKVGDTYGTSTITDVERHGDTTVTVETDTGLTVDMPDTPGAWVCGSSRRGSLGHITDGESYAFPTWNEAYTRLIANAREWAEEDDEAHDALIVEERDGTQTPEDYGSTLAAVDATKADGGVVDGEDWWFTIIGNDGMTERLFTIEWDHDRVPYDEAG